MNERDHFDRAVGLVIGLLVMAITAVVASGRDKLNNTMTSERTVIGLFTEPRIVYLAPVDQLVQNLYVVELGQAQKDAKQITDSEWGIRDYGISPDGKYIAYSESQENGSIRLMLYEIATGNVTTLQECADAACSNPVFRPDSRAIAFERTELNTGTGMPPGVPRVWVLDLVSGKVLPLFTDNQQLGYMPRWSPDGNLLAVFNTNVRGISVYNFTSGEAKTIPTVQGEIGHFSPDGKWLFFPKVIELENVGYLTHYVLVDLQSPLYVQTDLVPDTDPADDKDAIWTPDSKRLIVARPVQGMQGLAPPQLYSVDIAAGEATLIIEDVEYSHGSLSLSPSGDMLLFQRFPLNKPGRRLEIWTYHFETRELTRIAENATFARWLP